MENSSHRESLPPLPHQLKAKKLPVPSETDSEGKPIDSEAESQHPPQHPPQPPPTLAKAPVLAKALYSYAGEASDELSFRQHDALDILSDLSQTWWYARRRRGNRFGYVPCNYVLLLNPEITGLDAWFELGRHEAERLLLSPSTKPGTYLLRPSSTGYYALSVKAEDKVNKLYYFVQHYKITIMSGGGYYINPDVTFVTMQDLLVHYREHMEGLCCKLKTPCPHELPPVQSLKQLEINRLCITLDEKLGNGSFSDVFLGLWDKSTPVAVKILKPEAPNPKDLLSEAHILLKLKHANVLQLMAVCTSGEPFFIVTELMVNGDLLSYLQKDNGAMLCLKHLVEMMIQTADAMTYLETLKIVHRDLRAVNILVGENNFLKLADFGLARELKDSGFYICNENGKFPAKWTPIEAATKGVFSSKSDVWSFGVLIWEIITYGSVPYPGLANREVLEFVSRGYRMPNPNGGQIQCDQNMYHVMLQCWRSSPENRPTFSRLHEVLKAYMALYKAGIRTGG